DVCHRRESIEQEPAARTVEINASTDEGIRAFPSTLGEPHHRSIRRRCHLRWFVRVVAAAERQPRTCVEHNDLALNEVDRSVDPVGRQPCLATGHHTKFELIVDNRLGAPWPARDGTSGHDTSHSDEIEHLRQMVHGHSCTIEHVYSTLHDSSFTGDEAE